MASQLFPGGRFCMSTPSVRVWAQPACGEQKSWALHHTFSCIFPVFRVSTPRPRAINVYSYCLLTLTSFLYAHASMTAPWPVWYVMNVPFLKISFSITLEKSIPYRRNRLHKSWYMDRVPRNHSEAHSLALERSLHCESPCRKSITSGVQILRIHINAAWVWNLAETLASSRRQRQGTLRTSWLERWAMLVRQGSTERLYINQ